MGKEGKGTAAAQRSWLGTDTEKAGKNKEASHQEKHPREAEVMHISTGFISLCSYFIF